MLDNKIIMMVVFWRPTRREHYNNESNRNRGALERVSTVFTNDVVTSHSDRGYQPWYIPNMVTACGYRSGVPVTITGHNIG